MKVPSLYIHEPLLKIVFIVEWEFVYYNMGLPATAPCNCMAINGTNGAVHVRVMHANRLTSNLAVLESAVARGAGVRVGHAAVIVEVDVVGTVVKVAVLHILVGVNAGMELVPYCKTSKLASAKHTTWCREAWKDSSGYS